MSPRVPAVDAIKVKDITHLDVLTSSGKYPDRMVNARPTQATLAHAFEIAPRITRLQMYWAKQLSISSGYRPAYINEKTKNAAKHSLHMICAACDIEDPTGELAKFCLADIPMLEHIELWVEDPAYTKGWVHVQLYPPRSGKRVFIP